GGLARLEPLLLADAAHSPSAPTALSPHRDAVLAALNGVLGDHLEASRNPLAIPMAFRRDGHELDPREERGSRMLLLVHGLCRSDLHWLRKGHDHGRRLASEIGFTPAYLHYNSGRAIAANGRELAFRLEALVAAWGEPVEEITVVAHSMGGLVMRSACHFAELEDLAWRHLVSRIVFLGTPHQGAPLERGGKWLTMALDGSSYTAAFARLGRIRSAGITDLRFGQILPRSPEDSQTSPGGRGGAVPLPLGVCCYAIAATLDRRMSPARAFHPLSTVKTVLGDGLVPLASALGKDPDSSRALAMPEERCLIVHGIGHLDLLDHPVVYDQLSRWLATSAPVPP
ncbi:MAG: alpha/beta hydrolase, partial [Thermoanaerobaculia bacterium]